MANRFFDHPYAEFLTRVTKPTRYTGAEHGVVRKDWQGVEARICLAFPDVYDIGMSHLGFRILYQILNDDSRTLAERCYTPWVDLQDLLREHGLPLVSLESHRPLREFDVLGFSLQFELTYTNVLTMLEMGGVPLRAIDRDEDDPLVLGGGPVATHAEPVAPFFDALLVGDGEEATTEIALSWTAGKRQGLSRRERLERLASIGGVYVPSLYETTVDPESGLQVVTGRRFPGAPLPIERRLLEDIDRFPFPDSGPVGGPEAIFDRMSIEVARGCTEGCRFCQAGMIYRPVRERDPQQVVRTVAAALARSGQDEVSLTALSTADVSCISPLIKQLVRKTAPERVSLSVASLRAYGLAEDLLDDMRQVRASGLTFAPEAGTQRMRDVINKNVTEEQLLETAERVFSRGFDKMKLYFILGLPTETDEDVLGIFKVGQNAWSVGRRLGKRPKLTISVSTHVPKPHTPFQWCAMDGLHDIERKQGMLRHAMRSNRGITLRTHDAETSWLEGILARGDRRLADVIESAYRDGARFDSWDDQLRLDAWKRALEQHGIDTDARLGTLPVSARLPWDHIDVGLEEGFLLREYRKSLAGRLSPPCGKVAGTFVHHAEPEAARADQRRLVCYDCGIGCDLTQMRRDRIENLENMAEAPLQAPLASEVTTAGTADRDVTAEEPQPSHDPMQPERARPRRPGSPPARWRLRFSKCGPAALLGHLDLMREVSRIVRRAGVRTAYTQGFRPRPDFSYSPALSLGTPSLGEYVDVRLIDAPPPDEMLARLNASAPPGITFDGAAELAPGAPALSRVLTEARYAICIDSSTAQQPLLAADEAVRSFLAKDECPIRREVKGKAKWVDVRQLTAFLKLGGDAEREQLRAAGISGSWLTLTSGHSLKASGAARPGELVEALFGCPLPFQALRTALLADDGRSPLELAQVAPEASATKTTG